MKLTTTLNLTKQSNQCQFSVEIELDNNANIDEISAKTHKATAALKMAVNSIINKSIEYPANSTTTSNRFSIYRTSQIPETLNGNAELPCKSNVKNKKITRKYKVYRNRIQQKFMTEAPNMIWVSDITYVHVEDILCAIGVIIDLYARKVIAFDVAKTADSAFIQRMFDSAFEMRGKSAGLIFHSDQGTQYTAFEFRKHLRGLKVKSSFSNPGTPLDNAVAESFLPA